MFRSLALFCFAAVFTFSAVYAQDEPVAVKIRATPEILSLFEESLQSLSQEEPNAKAGGLFRLLGFAVNFDDKAPAQKIIDTLLALSPSIEPEELRHQLYTAIAITLCGMEKYPEAIEMLNRVPVALRSETQLDVAIRIIIGQERDKTLPPFDTTGLLRQAIAGAVESQNATVETLSHTFLGHELARQGKPEESTAAFAEAMRAAPKIKNIEERGHMVGAIFQRQIEHDQVADAMRMFRTVAPDIKPITTIALVSALIDRKKQSEAETLIKTLPSGEMRDDLLGSLVLATIETITDAKVGELVALVSTDELRERFLQIVTTQLQKNGRTMSPNKWANA